MPASAEEKFKSKRKRITFKSKKKLNPVLVKNNQILEIFQHLQAKLQRFRDYRGLQRVAQVTEKSFGCHLNRKQKHKLAFRCRNFTLPQSGKKQRLLKLTEHLELINFTNMVAKIDIDAHKI